MQLSSQGRSLPGRGDLSAKPAVHLLGSPSWPSSTLERAPGGRKMLPGLPGLLESRGHWRPQGSTEGVRADQRWT